MRKRSSYLAVAALAVAALSFQSCDFMKKGGGGADSTSVDSLVSADSIAFCTVMYEDTLTLEASISEKMKVDFPVPEAEGILADSLRAYLTDRIAHRFFPSWVGDAPEFSFEYKVGEEQEYLSAYAAEGMKQMVDAVKSMAEEGFSAGYENDYTASVALQTRKYVTLEESYSLYTGGAHGAFIASGVTFRKSDGKRMGWDLFDMSKKAQIVALIKDELRGYFAFAEGQPPVSEEELMEQLQLWDDPDTPENELEYGIPLPASEPYVVRDGIAFVYQQYEIASYACGLPSGTLSFEKVRELLSEEGRALLGL